MLKSKKRILIFDRCDSDKFIGGDTIQIHAIVSYLKEMGHELRVVSDPLFDSREYDIIFIFNLTRPFEAYMYAKAAIRHKKPYIIFPVYWNLDGLKMNDVMNIRSLMKKILTRKGILFLRSLSFYRSNKETLEKLNIQLSDILSVDKLIEYILNHSTYVCPNSRAELLHLEDCFPNASINKKAVVIYNGINFNSIQSVNKNKNNHFSLPQKYICCVGGIGPRKNQLNLVQAANRTGIPLVVIGSASKGNIGYEKKVKSIANSNVIFISHISQLEVFNILSKAVGHIQPSYIETPGLASLEAAALGCKVGVSDVGPVREYFGEQAFYCDPYSINSISSCLEKLYSINNQQIRPNDYFATYDWSIVLKPLNDLVATMDRTV